MKRFSFIWILLSWGGLSATFAQSSFPTQPTAHPSVIHPSLGMEDDTRLLTSFNYQQQMSGFAEDGGAAFQSVLATVQYQHAIQDNTLHLSTVVQNDQLGSYMNRFSSTAQLGYTQFLGGKTKAQIGGGFALRYQQNSIETANLRFASEYTDNQYTGNHHSKSDFPRHRTFDVGFGLNTSFSVSTIRFKTGLKYQGLTLINGGFYDEELAVPTTTDAYLFIDGRFTDQINWEQFNIFQTIDGVTYWHSGLNTNLQLNKVFNVGASLGARFNTLSNQNTIEAFTFGANARWNRLGWQISSAWLTDSNIASANFEIGMRYWIPR